MSSTIYARVSIEAKAWLDAQSDKTGISIAKIIDIILVDAARREITFEVRSPILVVDDVDRDD